MARSVSVPRNAVQVVYADATDLDYDDFSYAVTNMCGVAQYRNPGLTQCDIFVGREDRAVLNEEDFYIGISEYCGLVAVWAAPIKGLAGKELLVAESRATGVDLKPLAECFGPRLERLGTFSNGEGVFRRVK